MDQEFETQEEIEETDAVNELADGSDDDGEADAPADEFGEKEETEEQPEKKGKGVQGRINELTAARKKAEAERDYYRALAERGKESDGQNPHQPKPAADRPKQEEFETYAAYEDALVDWRISERERQAEEKRRHETAETERRELLSNGAEKYHDFEAVVTAPDLPINSMMVEAAKRTGSAPDVLYALGKDPQSAREIAILSMTDPIEAVFRIFKMAGGNEAGNTPAAKKTTNAPAPINPPKGGSPSVRKKPEDMTMDEYKRWRAQKG